MKHYLRERIHRTLHAAGFEIDPLGIMLEKPRQADHGDVATNVAMIAARALKKSPREIAQLIVDTIEIDPRKIADVSIAGPGFLNFRYADTWLHDELARIHALGADFGRSDAGAGRSVNLEWVSANPTGPLHAGHGRQVCLGETICNLLQWTGWTVTREYYFNNAGNQMQNLGLSIRERYRELCGLPVDQENIQYNGSYIAQIAEAIRGEAGDGMLDQDVRFFRERGEKWCFALILATLERIGVHHDVFFNEDTLYKTGKIDEVLATLKEMDLAYELDGAVWLRASVLGADKDRVIVKSSGEPTYRLPDIAYHREKILQGYDRIIDIFGADHIATYPDVLAGVQAMGLPVDHITVIIHQMVSFLVDGTPHKFSKRAGDAYTLDDLLDDVGVDAVRYFFVMRSAGSHLEFDLALAREQSEKNPVYYLQYAHARIASILRFAVAEGFDLSAPADLSLLAHPAEMTLIKTLLDFPEVVSRCAESYEVQQLCTYLTDLATAYHKFYHECRVVTENRALSMARVFLCAAAKQVLANGFSILGVSAPERM